MYTLVALATLLWLISAMLGIAACVSLVRAMRLRAHGAETTGRIIGHVEDSESSNVVAVVEYVVGGVSYRTQSNVYLPPNRYPLGATRRVAYIPSDPNQATIAGPNRYVPSIALSVVTIIIAVPAAALTYALFTGAP